MGVLEVRDEDSWSDKDEIALSVAKVAGLQQEQVKVISLRKNFGGAQRAVEYGDQNSERH